MLMLPPHYNLHANIGACTKNEGIPADLIKPQNRTVLQLFAKARTASLPKRLYYLKQSGVYRQRLLDNIGLLVATVLKRI